MIQKNKSLKIKEYSVKMKRKKKKIRSSCRLDHEKCQYYKRFNSEEFRCSKGFEEKWCKIERKKMNDCLNNIILISKL